MDSPWPFPQCGNIIFLKKGRGLGHLTPRIFGITSSIAPKPVKLESSKLAHSLGLAIPTGPKYNISERGRGLGHVTP